MATARPPRTKGEYLWDDATALIRAMPSTQTFFVLSAEDAAYSSYNAAVYLRKSVIGNFIAVMGTTPVVPISFL